MARRYDSKDSKRRILSSCLQLFLEKGYTRTTVAEIIRAADVSASTFQNIFRAKDGVLTDLSKLVMDTQLTESRILVPDNFSPAYIYAMFIAIQLTATELNANLRDIYVEAYTQEESLAYITHTASVELRDMFRAYLPNCGESEFYELELGLSGITRSYMAHPCDRYFTLDRKLRRYYSIALSALNVPREEQTEIANFILSLGMPEITTRIIREFFEKLSVQFDLELNQVDIITDEFVTPPQGGG